MLCDIHCYWSRVVDLHLHTVALAGIIIEVRKLNRYFMPQRQNSNGLLFLHQTSSESLNKVSLVDPSKAETRARL